MTDYDKMDYLDRDENRCPHCKGSGSNELDGGRLQWRCPDCEGTGIMEDDNEGNKQCG